MKRLATVVAVACVLFAQGALAESVEALLASYRKQVAAKQYNDAQRTLNRALAQEPSNDDIKLAQGYLYYYQGKYDAAKQVFEGVLGRHPGYTDARTGLARVEAAERGAEEQSGYRWQVDAGYEWSGFSRRNQPDWNNEFVQATRFFGGTKTAVHGRVERYDQFTNIDSYYQAGVDHRFTPRVYGYVHGGFSPQADFRPRWRAKTGGGLRLNELEIKSMPLWVTLDLQHDEYQSTEVSSYTPGLRLEPADNWAVSGKIIAVHEQGNKTVYGWSARLDGEVLSNLRFYAGYADAPETVAAVTVDTKTYFAGLAYDLDDARTLRLGYTHDDRERSYIRQAVSASVSVRF